MDRHFKTLMRKNVINWKRTPFGSILEICCPVMLMFILVFFRWYIQPEFISDFDLYQLKKPVYPLTTLSNGEWRNDFTTVTNWTQDFQEFFEFSNYTRFQIEIGDNKIFNPILDLGGPMFFMPTHCMGRKLEYNSTIVAVVKKNNALEQDMVKQLNLLFEKQKQISTLFQGELRSLGSAASLLGLDKIFEDFLIQQQVPQVLVANLTQFVFDSNYSLDQFLSILPLSQNQTQLITQAVQSFTNADSNNQTANAVLEDYNGIQIGPTLISLYSIGQDLGLNQDQLQALRLAVQISQGEKIEFGDLLQITDNLTASTLVNFYNNNTELVQSLLINLTTANVQNFTMQIIKYAFNDTSQGFGQVNIIEQILSYTDTLGNFTVVEFDSQLELDQYIQSESYGEDGNGICFGFSVNENSLSNYELELFFYDLFPGNIRGIPSQKRPAADPTQQIPDISSYQKYQLEGFVQIENLFVNTLLKRTTGNPDAKIVTMISPFKIDPYYNDGFGWVLKFTLQLFILLMYIPVLYRTTYRIVQEKSSKAKESMRMMGMTDFPYWLSWYVYYTIVNLAISSLSWLVLNFYVLTKSSGILLFIMFFLFGQSLFSLIMVTQSIFTMPRAAGITTTVVYFGSTIFRLLILDIERPYLPTLLISMFVPTVAMLETAASFATFETIGGLNFQTWNLYYRNFSVRDGLFCMIIGGTLLLLIGVYMEYVMPKTYGAQKNLCFCFKKSQKRNKIENQTRDCEFETKYLDKDSYEPVLGTNTKQFLQIQDLFKVYENGFKAVNGINLQMIQDQIFVLLGHNGAGKTTTVGILTGLIEATQGNAQIFGIDLFSDVEKVRKIMGVCPQYDVLFELLTVQEHLSFFYDLKGANQDNEIKQLEIEKLMKDIGVDDKRNALAGQLSGGNKRKLSVAIAICGSSKFIVLDEPTSGMDLSARRKLWNMLKNYKHGRIILLTTHYMDEADILGDRIGIMADGKMTCLGSSIFLKSKFGIGYNMTVVKQSPEPNTQILEYLKTNLGDKIKQQSEVQIEASFQVPSEYSHYFADFFKKFDLCLDQLGIRSYGFSMSTLEEVFFKKGHQAQIQDNESQLKPQTSIQEIAPKFKQDLELENKQNQQIDDSFLTNLIAVLQKRFNNYKRNKKTIFNEVILPSIIMLTGISISRITYPIRSPSELFTNQRLPQPQQLLINNQTFVDSDVTTMQLYNYLSNNSAFNLTISNNNDFANFGNDVFKKGKESLLPPYMYGSYNIYEANTKTQSYKFVSFVNLTSQDASALYPSIMYESILRAATKNPEFSYKLRCTPYPLTDSIRFRFTIADAGTVVFNTAICFSMLITAIMSSIVSERVDGLKHLQLISGMQLKAYWIGNFIFDAFKLEVICICTVIMFEIYGMNYDGAWITYLIVPIGILPFTYVFSFAFSTDNSAQTYTMFGHFMTIALISTIVQGVRGNFSTERLGDLLNWIFRIIPTYSLAQSVYFDAGGDAFSQLRNSTNGTGSDIDPDVFNLNHITGDLVTLCLHLVFWSVLLIVIERQFVIRFSKTVQNIHLQDLDDDVAQEQERVQQADFKSDMVVKNLSKTYQQKSKRCGQLQDVLAVSDVNFALNAGECFALLGVNGAGKSTTFKSLICEIQPTSGTIEIGGYNVQTDFEQARKLIGYCPQPNLIFPDMTVEEHMFYYASIKGLPANKRKQAVDQVIQDLSLQNHKVKPAGTLSGGNQRKLCVAQALIGNPPFVFLDEPSAGMDPEARRFMWSVVARIANQKSSAVVLTTHSMDEAEALSTKMGIMVKGGVFKCFGSSQHIKSKFGTGYAIEIKVKSNILNYDCLSQQVLDYIKQEQQNDFDNSNLLSNQLLCVQELAVHFGVVHIVERFENYIKLRVDKGEKSIGVLFGILDDLKLKYDIGEYSVSQTTLEQIFQKFANLETEQTKQAFELQSGMLHLI